MSRLGAALSRLHSDQDGLSAFALVNLKRIALCRLNAFPADRNVIVAEGHVQEGCLATIIGKELVDLSAAGSADEADFYLCGDGAVVWKGYVHVDISGLMLGSGPRERETEQKHEESGSRTVADHAVLPMPRVKAGQNTGTMLHPNSNHQKEKRVLVGGHVAHFGLARFVAQPNSRNPTADLIRRGTGNSGNRGARALSRISHIRVPSR